MPPVPTSARHVLTDADILRVLNIPETKVLDRAMALGARTLAAERVFILYADRTEQSIGGASVPTTYLLSLLEQRPGMAVIQDTDLHTDQNGLAHTWRQLDARFLAAVPLHTDCARIGYLCACSSQPRADLSADERESLAGLAHIVGALLDMRLLASEAMYSQMQARESERRFRSLADNAPLPIWAANAEGFTEYVNRAFENLAGDAAKSASFEDFLAFVHPEDRERLRAAWQQSASDHRPFEIEHRLVLPEGERWLLGNAVPRFLEDGAFGGYIGCCTDVTMHHRREQELERECDIISPALESSSGILVVTNPEGVIERFNAAAASALGLTWEHVLHAPLRELCQGFPEAFNATLADVVRTRRGSTLRACLAIPGAELRWYEWAIRPALDREGVLRHIVCAGRDLTATAEDGQVLRHLAAIAEASQEAICYMQTDGTIMTWNGAAERLFGYRAEEIVGRNIDILYPKDRLDDLDSILTRLDSGEEVVRAETLRRHTSGRLIDVALTCSVVRDEHGRVIGRSSVAREIAAGKRDAREPGRQEAPYRALIENALGLVLVLDAAGTIRFQSHSSEPLLGFGKEEMSGSNALDFIHPGDCGLARAQLLDPAAARGRTVHTRLRFRHKQGYWVTMEVAGRNLIESEVGGILLNACPLSADPALSA